MDVHSTKETAGTRLPNCAGKARTENHIPQHKVPKPQCCNRLYWSIRIRRYLRTSWIRR